VKLWLTNDDDGSMKIVWASDIQPEKNDGCWYGVGVEWFCGVTDIPCEPGSIQDAMVAKFKQYAPDWWSERDAI